jgi:hypothetical protein
VIKGGIGLRGDNPFNELSIHLCGECEENKIGLRQETRTMVCDVFSLVTVGRSLVQMEDRGTKHEIFA